jgi:hypothetical protein
MNRFKIVAMIAVALFIGACSQINAEKKAPALQAKIDASSDKYLSCAQAYATKYAASADTPTILAEGVISGCSAEMDTVKDNMLALAKTQAMLASFQDKQIKAGVEKLENEARAIAINSAFLKEAPQKTSSTASNNSDSENTVEQRLIRLESLYDKQLIDKEEYQEQKSRILDSL